MKTPFFPRIPRYAFWRRKYSKRCGHCGALLKPLGWFSYMHPIPLCHFAIDATFLDSLLKGMQ